MTDGQCERLGRHYGCACVDPPGLYRRIGVLMLQLGRRNTAQDREYLALIKAAIHPTEEQP
jgi:hypothetical protein